MTDPVEKEQCIALRQLRRMVQAEPLDGVALVENVEDNPICALYFDPHTPCVTVIWRRYATSAQLRFIHETILEKMRRHRVSKVLGDDTALPTIHADDRRWIVENWLPRALDTGLKAIASKKPASHFGKVSVREVQRALSPSLSLRAFEDIAEARHWLKSAARAC